MNNLQEKIQLIAPKSSAEQESSWVTPESQQRHYRLPSESYPGTPGEVGAEGFLDKKQNFMPVGNDATDTDGSVAKFTPLKMAGTVAISSPVNGQSLRNGFVKSPMDLIDTEEPKDNFYEDIGGFVERSNYLDRA